MNMHKNARRTPVGRDRVVRQVEIGRTPEAVSEAAGACPRLWLSAIVASCRDLLLRGLERLTFSLMPEERQRPA
jgi:hypothetical protein